MLNSFVGIGTIVNDAELVDGVARLELKIEAIPTALDSEDEPTILPVSVPSERGITLAPYLLKGTLVGARGRLHSSPGRGVWLEACEFNFLKGGRPW